MSDASRIILTEGATPAAPADGKQALYISNVDHCLYRLESSGVATMVGAVESGSTLSAARNFIINGSGTHWQRQLDPATLTLYDDNRYCADRWYIVSSAANVVQAARIDGEARRYAIRLKQVNATARQLGLAQIIEGRDCYPLRGKQVTLSMRVRTSAATLVKLGLLEWTGTEDTLGSAHDFVTTWAGTPALAPSIALPSGSTYTSQATVADTWHDLIFTATLGTTFTNLVAFLFAAAPLDQNVTCDIEGAHLVVGEGVSLIGEDESLERLRCLRYYETIGGLENMGIATLQVHDTDRAIGALTYHEKRVTPSVSATSTGFFLKQADGGNIAVTSLSFSQIHPRSCWVTSRIDTNDLGTGDATFFYCGPTTPGIVMVDAEL